MLPPKPSLPPKRSSSKVVPLKPKPLAVMPPFVDDQIRERAWCVATFDADSGKLIRASIYSSPARGLTQNLRTETLLEGPAGVGRDYQEARNHVVNILKGQPNFRWLWRAVRDYEAKTGMHKLRPGARL